MIPTPSRWHRPLLWLAAGMGLLAIASVVGAIVDPREVTGAKAWFKPLKFALSIGIYSVSLAWVLGLLTRRQRFFWMLGTISVVGLVVEIVIIVGAAILGATSHFNVSTPVNTVLWGVMATSIVVVWMLALVVSIALVREDLGDRARTVAIRAGALLAVVGMGLAFLMTSPTAEQLNDFQGVAGAHAVGVADDGPGLPVLGWSTVAGDLRIPHFVGMHALQVLPLLVLGLELASRRVSVLRDAKVRRRLVWIAVVTFALTIGTLAWQALAGQSIVQPSGAILVTGVGIAAAASIAVVLAVAVPRRAVVATKSEYEIAS